VSKLSLLLNRVLVGDRIALDEDFESQWQSLAVVLALNALIVFVPICAITMAVGLYDPIHGKPLEPALYHLLVLTNLVGFVCTFIASFQWEMNRAAIERQRQANRSRFEYRASLALLCVGTLLLLVIPLFLSSYMLLIVSLGVSSLLLQLVISERCLKTLKN
jgi:hypothetical protein